MKSSVLFNQCVEISRSEELLLLCFFMLWLYQYYVILFSRKQPPDYVLKEAKNVNKFFKCVGSVHNLGNGGTHGGLKSAYMALTEEEFEAVSNA